MSLAHRNYTQSVPMYPLGYVVVSTKGLTRKFIKPEQESNLYHPTTGRGSCQLTYSTRVGEGVGDVNQ